MEYIATELIFSELSLGEYLSQTIVPPDDLQMRNRHPQYHWPEQLCLNSASDKKDIGLLSQYHLYLCVTAKYVSTHLFWHSIRRAVMDMMITTLACDACEGWQWCLYPVGFPSVGMGVESCAVLVVGACGCRRRGERGKGDVGWRKLCWALIKACLGAHANCCGFWDGGWEELCTVSLYTLFHLASSIAQ